MADDAGWMPLNSTNLSQCSYDAATNRLTIEFHSGATWAYSDVSPDEYAGLLNAPSAGKYFNSVIKSSHPAAKIG